MGIKVFSVFICVLIGTGGGYIIMRTYRLKASYLQGLCALIAELKRNVAFKRESMAKVMRVYSAQNPLLKRNLSEYVAFADGSGDKIGLSRGFLSPSLFKTVDGFFSSLGKSDGATQITELDFYGETFSALSVKAADNLQKYGALSVKLGFLFGLCVGILIL